MTSTKRYDEYPGFIEVDGEVFPNYAGEDNGPRNSRGALMEEMEDFLYPELSSTPEPSPTSERVAEIIYRIKAKGLPISLASDIGASDERSDPYADLGGGIHTLRAGGITFQPRRRPPITNKPGYKTEAQRRAREHEAQARRDRWGN